MSNVEQDITLKLSNIEDDLITLLDLVDYKHLCEEKLGYTLDDKVVSQFIKKYNSYEYTLYEIDFDRNDVSTSAALTGFFSFCFALFSYLFFQSIFLFVLIIFIGIFGFHFFKKKKLNECNTKERHEHAKWEAYQRTLPFDQTVIHLMKKVIHNKNRFEYLSDFYKDLYLFLRNNY